MIRQGDGEPLVLLHGVTGSETMWRHVVPLLATDFDVIALTELGHRGGTAVTSHVTVADIVDDTETRLDALGLDRPHLAGNSLGGWVALVLARRGRAASVCALSPGGCWVAADGVQAHATSKLRWVVTSTKVTRPVLPLLAQVPPVRRFALRDNAVHGDSVSAADLVTAADDLLACTVVDDVLGTDERLAPLDPLPCPVLIAWSEHDRILPLDTSGAAARELVPAAEFRVLPGVGHVPMFDAPRLVADVIADAAGVG